MRVGDTGVRPLVAIIPARGGSKGLPGKNVRPLHGLPLIAHSIQCARATPEIDRVIVTTDDDAIAEVARQYGADVPFRRPPELASDTAAMWPVIKHALAETKREGRAHYGSVVLLDPTSPGRFPSDISEAVRRLEEDPEADGIIGVSEPEFNPMWYCVVEEGGYMRDLVPGANRFARRQDVPPVYRINGTLYVWRRRHVLQADDWRTGRLLLHVIPAERAINIDTIDQFDAVGAGLAAGRIHFPWLS